MFDIFANPESVSKLSDYGVLGIFCMTMVWVSSQLFMLVKNGRNGKMLTCRLEKRQAEQLDGIYKWSHNAKSNGVPRPMEAIQTLAEKMDKLAGNVNELVGEVRILLKVIERKMEFKEENADV